MANNMSRTLPGLRLPKRQGESAEALFLARAIREALCVARPWGDSARYAFIVDSCGRLLRIQVKSTAHYRRGSYYCLNSSADWRKSYSSRQVDYFAFYIIPLDLWYIIPARAVGRRHAIGVYPGSRHGKGRF